MNGLELSERYFHETGLPMLRERFPSYLRRIAAGLVGEGSECLGFDDHISRDHDWGPAFCLWLLREDFAVLAPDLRREYEKLPRDFLGYDSRRESEWGGDRIGVFEIGAFYRRFIGLDRLPATVGEWRSIPEENLATATNGKVFMDEAGVFTDFRSGLLSYYPEDVRLKKIAARCMRMAQSGQYNFPRCARRNEFVAAEYAKSQFAADAISTVFLLNRRYRPFYKWMHRALRELPVLGETVYHLMTGLFENGAGAPPESDYERKYELIERICFSIITELRRAGLSNSSSDFLLDHGPRVQSNIADPELRNGNPWLE